jgi:hypothetical protein
MGKKFKDEEGREWDMDKFDDTKYWTKNKDKGFYRHMKVSKGNHSEKSCSRCQTLF